MLVWLDIVASEIILPGLKPSSVAAEDSGEEDSDIKVRAAPRMNEIVPRAMILLGILDFWDINSFLNINFCGDVAGFIRRSNNDVNSVGARKLTG